MSQSTEHVERRSGKDRRRGLDRRDSERGTLRVPGSSDRRLPRDRRRTTRREEDREAGVTKERRGH